MEVAKAFYQQHRKCCDEGYGTPHVKKTFMYKLERYFAYLADKIL